MINELREMDEKYITQRTDVQKTAQEVTKQLQEYNKQQYDKRHKKVTQYKGDLVLI